VLFNATGKTVKDMTGKVFAKPIVTDKVNGRGTESVVREYRQRRPAYQRVRPRRLFRRDAAGHRLHFRGHAPAVQRADGQPATIADEQRRLAPLSQNIPLENLIGWKSASHRRRKEVLTQIRIKECATEADPENPWQDKDVEQIRVVTRAERAPTALANVPRTGKGGQKTWVPHANGTSKLPEIPLFPVYIDRTDFMQACPPLDKLAELNIAHWQSSATSQHSAHCQRADSVRRRVRRNGQARNRRVGNGAVDNPNAKLEYVEHTGAAIGAGDKDLQNLVLQMQAMGLQLLIDKPGQSATGEVRDDAKENSPLAMAATSLQDALTRPFRHGAFAGKPLRRPAILS
jgi:hypothetical protein